MNVLDISQTVLQEYFTMIMLVDASACTVPFAELTALLRSEGEKLGLEISSARGHLQRHAQDIKSKGDQSTLDTRPRRDDRTEEYST